MAPMAIKLAQDTLASVADVMSAIVGVIDDTSTVPRPPSMVTSP